NWDIPTLAGAGALRSSANDMLSFLAAFLGFEEFQVDDPLAAMLAERRSAGPGQSIGLAWHVQQRDDGQEGIVWHDGGTGGYRAYVGLDPGTREGVVVLTNLF